MFWFNFLAPTELLPVFQIEFYVSLALSLVLVVLKAYALVQSLLYAGQAYVAADKLTKPAWVGILFFSLLLQVAMVGTSPMSFLTVAFTIATLVFLVDVRPAVAEMQGGR